MKKINLRSLKTKAIAGNQSSIECLIDYYFVKKIEFKKALDWILIGLSHGSPHAMVALGYMYEQGEIFEKSPSQALYWFSRAAKKGDSNALAWLGYAYDVGYIVKKDEKRAFLFNKKAANKGSYFAQYNLAQHYFENKGLAQSKKAVFWWEKAALGGHVKAMCNLAVAYENGKGVEKSDLNAIKWYRLAVKNGDKLAAWNLLRLNRRRKKQGH